MIETYYQAGEKEKALELSKRFIEELFVSFASHSIMLLLYK